MYATNKNTPPRVFGCLFLLITIGMTSTINAQGLSFQVDEANKRLEMVENSSRVLTLEQDVPRVLVSNPTVVRVIPLAPNKVQVSALKPGVTQINLWDENEEVRSVDVIVSPDARQLEMILQAEFPKAAIRVRPLGESVLLVGYVDRPELVNKVVEVANDFYPKVINNLNVGGVHQVALHCKVMEVSRTKLRSLGADFAALNASGDFVFTSAAQLISAAASTGATIAGNGVDTVRFGVVDGGETFFGFIDALRQNNVIKVLAEPTVTAVSGRPAYFHAGGEFPIVVPQGLGTTAIEYKQFGTRVDFVPIVLGNGNIHLEVRPHVSEIDNTRGVTIDGIVVPALRDRAVDTAVEMRTGQTLAIAGLIQTRVEAFNRGIPWLADLPWAGALFRRVQENVNEIELLVTVRPELVDALDPHEVPTVLPGKSTTSPSDIDLFFRGHIEVPKTCPDAKCAQGPSDSQMNYANPQAAGSIYQPPVYQQGETMVPSSPAPSYGPQPFGEVHDVSAPAYNGPSIDSSFPTSQAPARGPAYRQAQLPAKPRLVGPSGYDEMDYKVLP